MTLFVTRPLVYYIRGLNTSGSDHIRFGRLDFGPMHKALQSEIEKHGVELRPLLDLGRGQVKEMGQRAFAKLLEDPDFQSAKRPLHILGHSAGGLITRDVATRLLQSQRDGNILTFVTMATPHRGAQLAKWALEIDPVDWPILRMLNWIGYDFAERRQFFTDFATPPRQMGSEMEYAYKWYSVVCEIPIHKMSWPLRLLHWRLSNHIPRHNGDGLVESSSQPWGREIGRFELDHLAQVGWPRLKPEFSRLALTLADFFISHSSK